MKKLPCHYLASALALALLALPHCARGDFSRGDNYQGDVTPDRYAQRQSYRDALRLIRTNQFTRYQRVKPSLRTYALYPYLEYTEHVRRISRKTEADILAFARQHEDTPLAEPLLRHWLANLASRGQWDTFLAHYGRVTPTDTLACRHGYALHRAGRTEEMMQAVTGLWLVDFSQPKECDPAFKAWREKGGLTPELAWQRFALATKSNRRRLAGYLMRYLHKSDKPYASNFRLVQGKPRVIKRTRSFAADNPRNREIILHGVERLARSDPEDALTTLNNYQSRHDFDPAALERAYARIGVWLALKSDKPELAAGLPVNLHENPELVEARIRQSLRMTDWGNVIVLINLLPDEYKASPRWRYWQARALATSPEPADRHAGMEIFSELSRGRTIYGFLAADAIGNSYSFEDEPLDVDQNQILSLERTPGIERALELLSLGERVRARREWFFSTRDFSRSEQRIAARVALRWGWHKAAIQTMINAEAWNNLDLRFPLAYRERFTAQAHRANIPVQWSLAVARQESAFMPDARSSAGALGLMQLMPSTAKIVAKKLGVPYPGKGALTEPELNIRLGTHYLGQMLRRYDNNRILATAAYNAGPGQVDRWLDSSMPLDVWIEVIPFPETRNYVQNVLMFSNIYGKRINEPGPLIYPHESSAFKGELVVLRPPGAALSEQGE